MFALLYYQAGLIVAGRKRGVRVRKSRINGKRKSHGTQSSEHLRHGNNCRALFVTNYLLHRINSSKSWLIIHFLFLVVNQLHLVFSLYDQVYSIINVQIVSSLDNYDAMLLVGSTTGVQTSPGHGGYQATAAKK